MAKLQHSRQGKWTGIYMLLATVTMVLFFSTNPIRAEQVQVGSQSSYTYLEEDRFTDVAGSGQSIETVRNKNDSHLIVAAMIGLATLAILGLLNHRHIKQKYKV